MNRQKKQLRVQLGALLLALEKTPQTAEYVQVTVIGTKQLEEKLASNWELMASPTSLFGASNRYILRKKRVAVELDKDALMLIA